MGTTPESEIDLMTQKEVAQLLRMSEARISQMGREGTLTAYKLAEGKSGSVRYDRKSVYAWLQSRRIIPDTAPTDQDQTPPLAESA